MATVQEKIEDMEARKEHIREGGGAARIERQHARDARKAAKAHVG